MVYSLGTLAFHKLVPDETGFHCLDPRFPDMGRAVVEGF